MMRPASLLTGLAFLTLACMPIMYAIRTLIGMKRKDVYPLLRIRLTDGTCVPVTTIGTHRECWKLVKNEGRWQLGSRS